MQTTNCNLEQLQGMSQFLTFPPMTQQLLNQRLFYQNKENQSHETSTIETNESADTSQTIQSIGESNS